MQCRANSLTAEHSAWWYKQGSQFFLPKHSRLSQGFVLVKKAILQVILHTIFALKCRCQRCSKNTRKTWKTLSQYNIENIEMLYILTFQVLSRFSAKFHVLSKFSYFLSRFQAISRPGQIIFKSPGFPGSTGNPVWIISQIPPPSTSLLMGTNKMALDLTGGTEWLSWNCQWIQIQTFSGISFHSTIGCGTKVYFSISVLSLYLIQRF